MYSETSGIYVMMDLPVDFLKPYTALYKLYYKTTTQINCGNPSDTIVHFAIVYLSPQAYARKRESTENEFESQKKVLRLP
jgi:hypothetical protein